jgi:acyl dehydratase
MAFCNGMLYALSMFERSAIAMLGLRNWNFLAPLMIGDAIYRI